MEAVPDVPHDVTVQLERQEFIRSVIIDKVADDESGDEEDSDAEDDDDEGGDAGGADDDEEGEEEGEGGGGTKGHAADIEALEHYADVALPPIGSNETFLPLQPTRSDRRRLSAI